jgi:hypothetical protein
MKLNTAPQTGLRRRKPGQPNEKMAFWGGILILCLFELVLMSKSWSSETTAHIFDFHADQAQAEDAAQPAN